MFWIWSWTDVVYCRPSQTGKVTPSNVCASQQYQKRTYDLNLQKQQYSEGDIVYKRNETFHKGHTRKLESPWTGPYLVVHCSPPLYTLLDRKRDVVYHHDKLKLCQDRVIPLWTCKLRNRFYQEEEEGEETMSPLQAEELCPFFISLNPRIHPARTPVRATQCRYRPGHLSNHPPPQPWLPTEVVTYADLSTWLGM